MQMPRADGLAETAEGFEAWVRPHLGLMTGLARRLAPGEAADVVQEALISAWRLRDRYDPERGTPQAWLLTLTSNAATRHLRTMRRHPVVLTAQPADIAAVAEFADLDLRRAVTVLSSRQRLAVDLYYYLDLPVAEVAAVMICTQGTVKSTLADARRVLRRNLEDQ